MPRLPVERAWVAACSALAVGLATGWLTAVIEPRGPITTATALLVIGLALLAGFAVGVLTARRWPVLIGFVGYAAAVEIVRRDLPGPTTDDFRLDSVYGVLAALVTRGFHGLLVLIPMFFAASLTVWLLRRRSVSDARPGRPVGAAILGVLTVLLAVWVAWPAGTPPVTNPDGSVAEGGVAELATVRVGDSDQVVMIRATDPEDPVLLYLSGGPGQSDLALARALTTGWVDDVVFADLDQRGNGKSYAAIDPVSAMTLDRAVDDVIEVSEYLRERFDEPKIYLMGESWGTILGVLAVQRRPDLYYAYIGSGQMADVLETDKQVYDDLVAYADRTGDSDLAAALTAVGEPPYADFPWANANLLAWYEYLYQDYTPSEGYLRRSEESGLDPFGITGGEYTVPEKMTVLRGLIDTFAVMYPQLYDVDLRESATRLEVPVYILEGAAELDARRRPAREWFEGLEAPYKEMITLDGAAHAVAFEQADEVQRLLVEEILPRTRG